MLGKKLSDALVIINWCTELGIKEILLPFDAELENQLFLLGFKCETMKYRNGKYITKVI